MTALNFPDSPSNGATYQGYTYNSTKTAWAKPEGASTTVVANVAALPTSAEVGDQAFVTATNRLYLWNGTGWYNIALINNTPTISGVSSAYGLAIDGTATTVTITATDPEGLPITYSIASDTSGNTATVTQGTGASTNVFTITPSTNTAHAGSFTLTFRASDGVNLATAPATFTLQFQVQNQNYTQALITSVGANNAVNNTFDDKSTSDHTITPSGDTHHCGMSPYRHGGYSTYFDGTGDVITVTEASSSFTFGTGDYTYEAWIYPTGSGQQTIFGRASTGNVAVPYIYLVSGSNLLSVYYSSTIVTSSGAIPTNAWTHIAISRESGTTKIFINGTLDGSASDSTNLVSPNTFVTIGGSGSGASNAFTGYISDVRIVKGTAVYTSNFTAPTERLTAVTNTSLLTCHLPYIADGSTTGHSITVNGGTHTLPFAPYDALEYSNALHLGSAHFDANGDHLDLAATADFGFGTGDFTVEGWYYLYSISNYPTVWDFRNGNGAFPYIYLRQDQSNRMEYFVSSAAKANGSISFPIKQWVHYAFVRQSGTTKGYLNGKQDFSVSDTVDFGTSNKLRLGAANGAVNYLLQGNISDFRVVKGTAVYTAEFTPPTAPLSTITNTALHLPMADGGIIDKAQTTNTLKLYGNAKSSTTQTKYLTSSIYLDGTGDYIDIAPAFSQFFDFGTLPFTVEFWMYLTNISGEKIILESRAGHSDAGLLIMLNSGVMKNLTSNAVRTTGGTTIAANTWYHVAVVRDSTSLRTYLNGTEESGSASYTSAVSAPFSKFRLGARFDAANTAAGYFSDVRITKGLARYTSNFTAPTEALQG